MEIQTKANKHKFRLQNSSQFDSESELDEDDSPELRIKKVYKPLYINPLLIDKGNALNGKALTEEECSQKFDTHHFAYPHNLSATDQLPYVNESKAYEMQDSGVPKLAQTLKHNIEEEKYILNCDSISQLTLKPARSSLGSRQDSLESSKEEKYEPDDHEHQVKQFNPEKASYKDEMTKLFKIENKFFCRQSSNNLRLSLQSRRSQVEQIGRTDTADFPMKLVTRPLIEENPNLIQSRSFLNSNELLEINERNKAGTPRFPTDEEIEEEEKRLLMTFAFKDSEELERFKKDMTLIINSEPIIERPLESKIRSLRAEIKSKTLQS